MYKRQVIDRLNEMRRDVLDNGASFATKAVLYSQDTGSRANGGQYSLTRKDPFVKEFKDAAFSLQEGEISEPFETEFGFHILMVDKIRGQTVDVRQVLLVPDTTPESVNAARKQIDSLKTERNFANYQLGLIYKEKFKENLLAAGKLESVLTSNPEERLIIPSKYNLYKIYEESGSSLATDMKYDIIKNHPESRYAEILLNPQAVLTGSADSPDAKYQRLYKMFQNQEFLQVITGAEENISKYTGDCLLYTSPSPRD